MAQEHFICCLFHWKVANNHKKAKNTYTSVGVDSVGFFVDLKENWDVRPAYLIEGLRRPICKYVYVYMRNQLYGKGSHNKVDDVLP